MTMTEAGSALETRMREAIAERSLLEHPFYRAWSEGTLELERLQDYARQYFHFERAFPRFLSAIHARTESPAIRQLLLSNLWDEEYGERNHPALWLEFAAALGVSAEEVEGAEPHPGTSALIEHYAEVAQNAPVAEALATLFAYESQVPAIAWEKIKGLTEHYDLLPEQFEFFSVHLVSDVAHSGAEISAIEEICEDEEAVVAAAERASERLLGFLDGCYGVAA
ncbi:MAG: CADD family putative folate metabolism protein [Dehalococcoidia bacterium]|nr:CADD family putative folate metabolism protein [Dehalococcoidia bacterium]